MGQPGIGMNDFFDDGFDGAFAAPPGQFRTESDSLTVNFVANVTFGGQFPPVCGISGQGGNG